MSKIKNIFDWLNEVTYIKSPVTSFSDEDWSKWNSFLIHRYVSMNRDYIDIVNYIQTIPYTNKEQIYTIYSELLPKKKQFLRYIKNENKNEDKEVINYVSIYFQCSTREALDYVKILGDDGVKEILEAMGGLKEEKIKKIKKKNEIKKPKERKKQKA